LLLTEGQVRLEVLLDQEVLWQTRLDKLNLLVEMAETLLLQMILEVEVGVPVDQPGMVELVP
jgi:hypothetical protein